MLPIHNLTRLIHANKPLILTVAGSIGVVATAVVAARNKTTADQLVEKYVDRKAERQDKPKEDLVLGKREYVELTWKTYLPAVCLGASTIACIWGAHTIYARRTATLLSLYSLTDTAYKEYRDAVKTEIGETAETKVVDTLAKKQIETKPPTKEDLMLVGEDETVCFDTLTGRYFKSDPETIRAAVNDINRNIINQSSASLNEFYSLIGLEQIEYGEDIGWGMDNMIDVHFTSVLTPKNKPCLAINYVEPPVYNYDQLTGV